jgi:hypothetical protein
MANTPQPGFLGIGAQKAGTTWLFAQMRHHDQLYLPMKEVHYFDRSPRYPSSTQFPDKPIWRDPLAFGRTYAWVMGSRFAQRPTIDRELPRSRFLSLTYDEHWYQRLFADAGDRLAGEISPSYAFLDIEDISAIKRMNPACKLILLLREPVDRAWSAFKFRHRRTKVEIPADLEGAISKFLDLPGVKLRGDYIGAIRRWRRVFPADQMFIGFYDDICSDPLRLINQILRFLEVDEFSQPPPRMLKKINSTAKLDRPPNVDAMLRSAYADQIEELAKEIDLPASWSQRAGAVPSSAAVRGIVRSGENLSTTDL